MTPPLHPPRITYGRVAAIALPVVLSNVTVPLQGAIDTAIIGNLGEARFLAAVTLGATAITLLLASFNFLQMGASGLAAQALGAGDRRRVMNTLVRAGVIAVAIGAVLLILRAPLGRLAMSIFEGSDETQALGAAYLRWRLLGAPAELANYALIGWFAGQALTRRLFELQIVISLANIVLNLTLVLGFGWGVEGVAFGTALAAWVGLAYGLWRVRQRAAWLAPEGWRPDWARILDPAELRQVMTLNRDIFIRTVCLTGSFAWMARLGSMQGDVILAANGVLMQFLHIASYALDGFAMAAETLVGQAIGARDRGAVRRAAVVSTIAAFGMAAVFAGAATLLAPALIDLFTNVEAVRAAALEYALWATCIPLIGVLAYQLDGIFIGAAEGRGMRNAMVLSAAVFVPLSWAMTGWFGNHGLWMALWVYMAVRTVTLMLRYGGVEERAAA
jgi:MATE family multidrug resistance protein